MGSTFTHGMFSASNPILFSLKKFLGILLRLYKCFADDIAHGSFYMQMSHLIILFFELHQWEQGIKAHTRHVLLYNCRPNTWSDS